METQAIFPIAYFGSVKYFQDLVKFQGIALEYMEHFPKQTFRNRAVILTSQGAHILTVPLEKPSGSKTATKDVLVSYQQNWPLVHWKALKTSYASAPYFEHYASYIEKLLFKKHRFLVDFNLDITRFLMETWQLPTNFDFTESYEFSYPEDFRSLDYENLAMNGVYSQVQFGNTTFHPAASSLDLLFCEGPMGRNLII